MSPIQNALESSELKKEEIDEIILVGGSTRIPKIKKSLNMFFNKKPSSSINPDEVVSMGAAIQAYIISHDDDPFSDNVVLLDIIALSLGVETIGGVMNTIIPRNSVIPISKKKLYSTDSDYVESVDIKVFEGERKMTKDNFLIGELELNGIKKAPRGIPEIEVTFSIDINGIINVTAKNLKDEENYKKIVINNKNRLTIDEIKNLVNEAKKFEINDTLEKKRNNSCMKLKIYVVIL